MEPGLVGSWFTATRSSRRWTKARSPTRAGWSGPGGCQACCRCLDFPFCAHAPRGGGRGQRGAGGAASSLRRKPHRGTKPAIRERRSKAMAKLSIDDESARVERMTGYEGRYREADGYTIAFERFEEGGDFTPFYKGLPDDRCQSHHWGYVVKGRLTMHMPDGDEIVHAGEAY